VSGPFSIRSSTMATTVSAYLPAMVSAMTAGLPVELVERILTRLPVSAVIELAIVEDEVLQHKDNSMATGYISRCILSSLGWRAVFPNRDALLELCDIFRLIAEAYQLVYRRPFSHDFVRREKIGVKENDFHKLRSALSKHTRQLGPAHQVLMHLHYMLRHEHVQFVREVWFSMKDNWTMYMGHAARTTLADIHPQAIPVQVMEKWLARWVTKGDPNMVQAKLRFMVSAESSYREQLGHQLNHHSTQLKQYPTRLKKLGDTEGQSRPNMQHVVERFDQDARDVINLNFAARKKRKGTWHFRQTYLPVLPLDKSMWFLLECRAQVVSPLTTLPPSISRDMATVMDGITHTFIGTEGTNFPNKTTVIPRLLSRDKNQLGTSRVDDITMQLFKQRLLNGHERRPVFTTPPMMWATGWEACAPHDPREIQWLDAFLRCCEHFAEMFPDILAKVEEDAKKEYRPCPVAEARLQRKISANIAADLSLRGAKFEMLIGK
jgi:hypothetical protein